MASELNLNLGLGGSQPAAEEAAPDLPRPEIENVIIIGSGPAGWSAAIYTARAMLRPLLLTGSDLGGQVAITSEVENYPGFPEGLTGPQLAERMQKQAEQFGTGIEIDFVTELDTNGPPFTVKTASGKNYRAKAILLATGASARRLGVPNERALTGRGVSYCATCDGFFFRGKELVVVGGGDSALEEALFLTKFASKVRVVHRRDELRAGATLQRRARENPKIEFIWNSVVVDINGQDKVQSVTLKDVNSGEESELATDGVFIYIGHTPNNQLVAGKLAVDDQGYVVTDKLMRTSVPGIFAAGEIQDPHYRQVATSVGQGVAAALSIEKWIDSLDDEASTAIGEGEAAPVAA